MTEKQEFHGASVDEALESAAAALGTDPGGLEFEVLDEGSAGFLGIGARDARISVVRREAGSAVGGAPADLMLEDALSEEGPSAMDVKEDAPSEQAASAPEELLLSVDRFATELVEAMGLDGTVDAHDAGEVISVEVVTKQTGLFIGQKGETIDAIQYLLNLAVYRDRPFVKRIVVDTEGYRQRRVEAIQGMAHRIARRAQREKRSFSLPPMSPAERRVVHMFLKENPKVSTASQGQDEDRRVVISPS